MSGPKEPSPAPRLEAVVVAAGASRRMGGIDKLSASVAGKPVLQWSVEALVASGVQRIAVVTSPDRIEAMAGADWLPPEVVAVVAGGLRRQESVAAGVAALADDDVTGAQAQGPDDDAVAAGPGDSDDPVILIHDAARPVASPELCRRVAAAAGEHGAAIPVLAVAETLKRIEDGRIAGTVEREGIAAAQTPQGFRRSVLEQAYAAFSPDGERNWTDEAALLEACRIPVYAIDGEARNLKVTLPGDLEQADALLGGRRLPAPPVRVGFGTDGHPFGRGEPLVLGGLRVPGMPRLSGHSDGDVVLHAVADALLGAAALGDLGRHFPADERTPEGVDSRRLLGSVVEKVRAAGWRPASVDLTIVAARPRLAELLGEMAGLLSTALDIPLDATSVKASTGNLEGAEGTGRGISAHAVAVLVAVPAPSSSGVATATGAADGATAGRPGGAR